MTGVGVAPQRRRIRPLPLLVGVIVVLLVAMWVYALVFASKKATYRVDDDAWRARAEEICRANEVERRRLADIDDGYITDPTPEQIQRRAELVSQATDLLEDSLDAIVALPLDTDRDRTLVADYERYYRIIIADRRVYEDRLRDLDVRPYGETKVDGGPVSNVVIDFTTVNEIGSCRPPSDLTGGAI